MADPFATAQELSNHTQGYIAADDPAAADALSGTSKAVRKYCGWQITPPQTDTLTINGPGGYLLQLPSLYVTAVTSVTESGNLLTEGTDYQWSENGLIRRLGCPWSCDYRDIVVVFTHGYDPGQGEDADDVKQVVLAVAARNMASPVGAISEGSGAENVRWSQVAAGVAGGIALLPHELAILDEYKIPRFS